MLLRTHACARACTALTHTQTDRRTHTPCHNRHAHTHTCAHTHLVTTDTRTRAHTHTHHDTHTHHVTTHTHTHTHLVTANTNTPFHTHTRTHARTRARTRAHAHTPCHRSTEVALTEQPGIGSFHSGWIICRSLNLLRTGISQSQNWIMQRGEEPTHSSEHTKQGRRGK